MATRTGRHVTLIAGPPCSGKTTWARQRANEGDLIVDHDLIAQELGSPTQWDHGEHHRDAAEQVMQQRIREVADMASGTAWVVRTAAEPNYRAQLAEHLRANRVVVLLPSLSLLIQRARQRPEPVRTVRVINRWMSRYAPAPCDELVTTGSHRDLWTASPRGEMRGPRPNPQALWNQPQYRARRKTLIASATPQSKCWRCGKRLQEHRPHRDGKPVKWTAGHIIDGDPRSPLALEASTCNYRAGGTIGARITNRAREPRSPNA
jgi:predicted kinase